MAARFDDSTIELRNLRLQVLALTRENHLRSEAVARLPDIERQAHDAERRADEAERRFAEASRRIADLEYETWKPPPGTSLFVRLRWSVAKTEPAFPRVIGPLKRLYWWLFRKPRHARAPGP